MFLLRRLIFFFWARNRPFWFSLEMTWVLLKSTCIGMVGLSSWKFWVVRLCSTGDTSVGKTRLNVLSFYWTLIFFLMCESEM